jgi:hypothetical protein
MCCIGLFNTNLYLDDLLKVNITQLRNEYFIRIRFIKVNEIKIFHLGEQHLAEGLSSQTGTFKNSVISDTVGASFLK